MHQASEDIRCVEIVQWKIVGICSRRACFVGWTSWGIDIRDKPARKAVGKMGGMSGTVADSKSASDDVTGVLEVSDVSSRRE